MIHSVFGTVCFHHEHTHAHPHSHGDQSHTHEHTHSHTHDGGAEPHTHEHEELAEHTHAHGCGHDCGACATSCDPMQETLALMGYMVNHNAAHARELAELAKRLGELGNHTASEQVLAAVSEFEKGNLRLSAVLASLK